MFILLSIGITVSCSCRELEEQHGKTQEVLEEYNKWKLLSSRDALSRAPTIAQTLQSVVSLPRVHWEQPSPPTSHLSVELPPANVLTSLGSLGRVSVTLRPAPIEHQEGDQVVIMPVLGIDTLCQHNFEHK